MPEYDANAVKREQLKRLDHKLRGMRLEIYRSWRLFGPKTTKELADRTGLSLLTLRPRTTELLQLGLLKQLGMLDGEGVYEAVDVDAAAQRLADLAAPAAQGQFQFAESGRMA